MHISTKKFLVNLLNYTYEFIVFLLASTMSSMLGCTKTSLDLHFPLQNRKQNLVDGLRNFASKMLQNIIFKNTLETYNYVLESRFFLRKNNIINKEKI